MHRYGGQRVRHDALAQLFLRTLDGKSARIEQRVDPLGERHVGGPIIAAIARSLQRAKLSKLGFPIAQDMRRQAQLGAQFADRQHRPFVFLDGGGHEAICPARSARASPGWRGMSSPGAG